MPSHDGAADIDVVRGDGDGLADVRSGVAVCLAACGLTMAAGVAVTFAVGAVVRCLGDGRLAICAVDAAGGVGVSEAAGSSVLAAGNGGSLTTLPSDPPHALKATIAARAATSDRPPGMDPP